MKPRPLSMAPLDWLMLIGLSFLWGGAFFLNKVALAELPPLTVAFARVGIAAVILVAIAWMRDELRPVRTAWPTFILLGLVNSAVPFALIAWGQTHIASGLAAIINATVPLFAVLIANAATEDDKLTRERLIGLGCGLIGVVVMIGPGALRGLGLHVAGELACLTAAALYAAGTVYARKLSRFASNTLGAGQTGAATLLLLAPVAFLDQPWALTLPSTRGLVALVVLGALSTALAYLLYFRILARVGATNTTLVTFLIPVTAVLLGVVVLGERLEAHQLAGMAAIAVGLLALDGRAGKGLAALRGWFARQYKEFRANGRSGA
jgi:drug/metabolite transporter (DMT)-like permease